MEGWIRNPPTANTLPTRRRARWAGWLLSLLIHALLLAGAICAGRNVSHDGRVRRGIDTRLTGADFTFTLADEVAVTRGNRPIVPILAPMSPLVQPAPTPDSKPIVVVAPGPKTTPKATVPAQIAVSGAPIPPPAGGYVGARAPGGVVDRNILPVAAIAHSIVFVLDRSASMGVDDRLSAARTQIAACLRDLPAGMRFQIVAYNRKSELLILDGQTGMAALTEQARAEALGQLNDLIAEGGNDHLEALMMALHLQPDAILLLTDADDLSPEQVRAVTNWNRGRCRISAVTFGSAPRQAMQNLAANNRGVCKLIEAPR